MKGDYQIPYTESGDQRHYPEHWCGGLVWRDNEIFDDTLTFECYMRGRSAAYLMFRRASNGSTVVVFLSDFEAMVPMMVRGEVAGRFTFVKKGQNYGCKLA